MMNITIEVSSNCQAKCPGCIRHDVLNTDTGTFSSPPKNLNLSVDVHNRLIDEIVGNVKQLTYDGSFGDSPFHPDFLELVEYSASKLKGDTEPFGDEELGIISPEYKGIHDFIISTNGSYKTPEFWKKLGEILHEHLPGRHHVMFDLDGIDNKTQNMYRIDTNYPKIIENAEAFISGGGSAVWKMIPFDFNEELEERAKILAKQHGFKYFQRNRIQRVESKAVVLALSKKAGQLDKVVSEDNELSVVSNKDIDAQISKAESIVKDIKIDKNLDMFENLENARENVGIVCKWEKENNYQISHDGSVWRCCWINSAYQYKTRQNIGNRENWEQFVSKYDNDWNNLHSHSFSDIINHVFFTKDLEESFSNRYDDKVNPKLKVCTEKCSKLNLETTDRNDR
jgi:hypothetical protein|tara:strand:+ start:4230 stop:5420 length:1191 start_codon:yes stop_codon:yes gene_type:complete